MAAVLRASGSLCGAISHEELDAAVRRFKKAIIERALGRELSSRTISGIRRRQQARAHHQSSQWDRQQDGAD
jgi:hypothetical protein